MKDEIRMQAFQQKKDILKHNGESSDEEEFHKILELDELLQELKMEIAEDDESFRATIGGFSQAFEDNKWGKMLKFFSLITDLHSIIEENSEDIQKVVDEVISPSLYDFANDDHFAEVVELASVSVSVLNQRFW